jgi:hypothetical protein
MPAGMPVDSFHCKYCKHARMLHMSMYIPHRAPFRFTRSEQPDWSATLFTDGFNRDWYFSYQTLIAFASKETGLVINRDMGSTRATSNHLAAVPIASGTHVSGTDSPPHRSVSDRQFTELMAPARTALVDPSPSDQWVVAAQWLEQNGHMKAAADMRLAMDAC